MRQRLRMKTNNNKMKLSQECDIVEKRRDIETDFDLDFPLMERETIVLIQRTRVILLKGI